MQNHILDPESKYYVQHADKLIKQIHSRLEAARKKTNIFFLPEIYQSSEKSRMKKAKICKSFLHLLLKKMKKSSRNTTSRCHRKAYLRLNKKLLTKMKKKKHIEVVGTETNLCVLSNTIALQSVFPEADFLVDTAFVSENKHGDQALKLLKDFNVELK